MLVTGYELFFESNVELDEILFVFATWLTERCKMEIEVPVERLAQDEDRRLPYGRRLITAVLRQGSHVRLGLSLSERDFDVPGRYWTTELGLDEREGMSTRATIILKTRDLHLRAGTAATTRQGSSLADRLMTNVRLARQTIGRDGHHVLNQANAKVFLDHVTAPNRKGALVVVSPRRDGSFAVDVPRLQQSLVGIGQVYQMPDLTAQIAVQDVVPSPYTCFNGAINVIYPANSHDDEEVGHFTYLPLLPPGPQLPEEDAVWGCAVDATVANISGRHPDPGYITDIRLRDELTAAKSAAGRLAGTPGAIEATLRSQVDSLNAARTRDQETIGTLRETVETLEGRLSQSETGFNPTLHKRVADLLPLIEERFAGQLEVTKAASKSMWDSPYQQVGKAWTAFTLLAGPLREMLAGRMAKADANALIVAAGMEYNAHTSGQAKGRYVGYERLYKGRPADMDRHLKLGTGSQPERCMRIHFEYDQETGYIVVHHAGRHLPNIMKT